MNSHLLRNRQASLFATAASFSLAPGGGIIHISCNRLTPYIESDGAGADHRSVGIGPEEPAATQRTAADDEQATSEENPRCTQPVSATGLPAYRRACRN